MTDNRNRELVVSIQRQIESLPVSRYYRAFQAEVGKLSLAALTDLKEILNEIEQMGHLVKRQKELVEQGGALVVRNPDEHTVASDMLVQIQKVAEPEAAVQCNYCSEWFLEGLISADGLCEDCAEEEAETAADDCPECNGCGEIFEGEADVSSCARCEGTGMLS